MRIRGHRQCAECGDEWSYYETGEVTCPTCGSMHSVGVEDEGQIHTDSPVELDLVDLVSELDTRPLREIAADVETRSRDYVTARGFVNAGELQPVDDGVLAAAELRHVAAELRRSIDTPTDEEEAYFLELIRDAPRGERPGAPPESLYAARGLATATVLDAYRRDIAQWLEEHPDKAARETLGSLREWVRRIHALDGDVPPAEADRLVAIARDIGEYLREGDEMALARARDRLEDR